jgi:N-acetyl-alpha-D-muramate 1-phosphate uridylyltransferase
MKPDAAMLFAAGRGTRMRELTNGRPKALVEVAGRTLIDHALDQVEAAGIGTAVVNTHYHADQLSSHLTGRRVVISHEPHLLETGGGLRNALPLLGEGPVFTLNADAIYHGPNVFSFLADAWEPEQMRALLLLVPRARAVGHLNPGDFFLDEGRLRRRRPAPEAPFVYASAQIIDPSGLADCPDEPFSLNVYWDRLIAEGTAFGIEYPGQWADLGQPESIALAEEMLSA